MVPQLRNNWEFLLLSQIVRGKWMIDPNVAVSAGHTLQKLLNRDWDGNDQAEDLEENRMRAKFPVAIIGAGANAGSDLDKAPSNSTAIIPVKGTMIKYGTLSSYGTEEIASALLEAGSHKNVGSVILDIDTGGGAVDAIAPLIQAISKVQNDMNKPVIASVDLCASAGYYIASKCDKIIANNDISSEIGSIGVLMSFADIKPMWEKEGVKFHTIYAPESTHKNEPFEKALEGKYDLIKTEELSPLAKKFQEDVKKHRGDKLKADTDGILSGKMFFSLDAKEVGLIDEVGSLDIAIEMARDMASTRIANQYVNNKS